MSEKETSTNTGLEGALTTAEKSSHVFIIKVTALGAGFISNFILARLCGPEVLGDYSMMLSIVNIVSIFGVFGLNKALVKYIPAAEESGRQQQSAVAFLSIAMCLVTSGLLAVLLFTGSEKISAYIFKNPKLASLLRVGALGIVPLSLVKALGGLFRGLKKSDTYSLLQELAYKVILLIAISAVILIGLRESIYVSYAWFAAQTILLYCLYKIVRKYDVSFRNGWTRASKNGYANAKKIAKYASTMVMVSAVSFAMWKIDIIMAGIYVDSDKVGVYKVALVLATAVTLVLASSNTIFPSFISELHQKGEYKSLEKVYKSVTKWVIVLTLPIVCSFLLFPHVILGVFGPDYGSGANVLIVLTLGNFVNVSVGSNGYLLNMSGREKISLINNVVVAGMNILLNVLLIPKIGVIGAAVASSISIGTISIIKVYQVYHFMDILPYRKNIIPVFAVATLVGILGFALKSLIVNIFLVLIFAVVTASTLISISLYFRTAVDTAVIKRLSAKLMH
jgi:O-antigen/teichoic acid export membrane protein